MALEIYMGIELSPASELGDNGRWRSRAVLRAVDGNSPAVHLMGWPLEHGTEKEANQAAMAAAKRRIHRGQWRDEDSASNFTPLA